MARTFREKPIIGQSQESSGRSAGMT
jgi:hypothetical protein